MSAWTHSCCERCWIEREGEWRPAPEVGGDVLVSIRRPVRIREPDLEQCCFCGAPTIIGIYVMHDPKELSLCSGHDL